MLRWKDRRQKIQYEMQGEREREREREETYSSSNIRRFCTGSMASAISSTVPMLGDLIMARTGENREQRTERERASNNILEI